MRKGLIKRMQVLPSSSPEWIFCGHYRFVCPGGKYSPDVVAPDKAEIKGEREVSFGEFRMGHLAVRIS